MPSLRLPERVRAPRPQRIILPNGLPLYCINQGQLEVARLDLVFRGGRWTEQKPLVATGVAGLLMEGTHRHSAAWIAEQTDFYGSSLGASFSMDSVEVSLFGLTRHYAHLLPIMMEVVCAAAFPKEELQSFIAYHQARLLIDLEQIDVVAFRVLTEKIFGTHHPYGYNSTPEAYAQLTQEDLLQYVHHHFHAANAYAVLSGRFHLKLIDHVCEQLAQLPSQIAQHPPQIDPPPAPTGVYQHVYMPHTSQTAIYLGRRLWPRHHPDFPAFYILVTLLGGFFGSRLIKRIREKLGYTYNIYAEMETMAHDGYLLIATETATERAAETLSEIFAAIRRLQLEPPDEEELRMLRSYLLGNLLAQLDGPFNQADYVRTHLTEQAPLDMVERIIHTLHHIKPHTLQELACKWLDPQVLTVITVGPKKIPHRKKPKPYAY